VTDPPASGEPPLQLKGFEKIFLKPGESKEVAIPIAKDAFSSWDEDTHGWVTYPGTYTVSVGSSSRDIRLKTSPTISP
jgi:beta-glucosidase